MPDDHAAGTCCDRYAGGGAPYASRIARRRLLKAAVFQPVPGLRPGQAGDERVRGPLVPAELAASRQSGQPGSVRLAAPEGPGGAPLPRTVTGRIVDVSPHVIVLGDALGEQRFALTADTAAWRGRQLESSALQPGDLAVIRLRPGVRAVADRIWANIARVTGIILRRERDTLLVDQGHVRDRQVVVIPDRAIGRVQVRFPNLQPGYLIDVIGLRHSDSVEGLQPATSQPPYRADRVPEPALITGHLPDSISGSATWYDAPGEPRGILGAGYPAIDPATGCAEEAAAGPVRGFRTMPYLAVGSVLVVRNECTGQSCPVPVTSCAPVARLFNDRCLECGTSERGRVAELTLASFVALGGELDRGCFNATISVGR